MAAREEKRVEEARADEDGEGEEEEEKSLRVARLAVPVVFGGLLFLGGLGFLGWSESRFVCDGKDIQYAEASAQTIASCDAADTRVDQPIYFSCPVDQQSLRTWSESDFDIDVLSDNATWQGIGAKKQVKFYGCKETRESNRRRSIGYRYRYAKEWVNADAFTIPTSCERAEATCGASACEVPSGSWGNNSWQQWGSAATPPTPMVAGFEVNLELLASVTGLASTLWGETYSDSSCEQSPTIGCEKVEYTGQTANYLSFFGTSAGQPTLGQLLAPGSFGCEGGAYWQLVGSDAAMTKEAVAQMLLGSNSRSKWLVRGLCLLSAVLGLSLCLVNISDLQEEAQTPCLVCVSATFEGVSTIVIVGISAMCGFGCVLFVVAIFQILLYPLVGGGMLVGALLCCGAAVAPLALRKVAGAPKKKAADGGTQLAQGLTGS